MKAILAPLRVGNTWMRLRRFIVISLGIGGAPMLIAIGRGAIAVGDDAKDKKEVVRLAEQALTSKDGSFLAFLRYSDLFQTLDARDVDDLVFAESDSTAMLARWSQMRRTVGTKVLRPEWDEFVGFAEGRLRVPVPEWWENKVRDAASEANLASFLLASAGSPKQLTEDCWSYEDLSLEQKGQDFTLVTNDGTYDVTGPLSDVYADRRYGRPYVISIATDSQHLYMAVHGGFDASDYQLWAISRASGKPVWQRDVWGTGSIMVTGTALFRNRASVVVSRDRVAVFGVSYEGAYTSVFRIADGIALARFYSKFVPSEAD